MQLLNGMENVAPGAIMEDEKKLAKTQGKPAKQPAAEAVRKPLTAFFTHPPPLTYICDQTTADANEKEPDAMMVERQHSAEQAKKLHPFFTAQLANTTSSPHDPHVLPSAPHIEDLTVCDGESSPFRTRRVSTRAAALRAKAEGPEIHVINSDVEVVGSSDDDEVRAVVSKRRRTRRPTDASNVSTSTASVALSELPIKQPSRLRAQGVTSKKRGLMDRFFKPQTEPTQEGGKLQAELARSREATVTFFGGKQINPFFLDRSKRPTPETMKIDLTEDESPAGTSLQWLEVPFPLQQHVFGADISPLHATCATQRLEMNGLPIVTRIPNVVNTRSICPRESEVPGLYEYCGAARQAFCATYTGAAHHDGGILRKGQLFENPNHVGPYLCPPTLETSSRSDLRGVWEASIPTAKPGMDMLDIIHQFAEQLGLAPEYVQLQIDWACGRAAETSRKSMLWVEKYKPMRSADLCSSSSSTLEFISWLKQWSSRRKKPSKSKAKRSRRGWDSDDDSLDDDRCKVALLFGKNGTGKTTTVYTCASQLGYNVLEVKPDERRQGAELRKRLAEATQSHRVSSKIENDAAPVQSQKCPKPSKAGRPRTVIETDEEHTVPDLPGELTLVLFEQADILFDDESGFYSSIKEIAKSAKCPLVITSELSLASELQGVDYLPLPFEPPTTAELAFRLALVCHAEQLQLNALQLAQLAHCSGHDIRAALHTLQLHAIKPDEKVQVLPLAAGNSAYDFAELHCLLAQPDRSRSRAGLNRTLQFLPVLLGTNPRVVNVCESFVLYGSNFLQPTRSSSGRTFASTVVRVGNIICDHQVLSNEMIEVALSSQLRPGTHRIIVRVGNLMSTLQLAWHAVIKVVAPDTDTQARPVDCSTEDFTQPSPSPTDQHLNKAKPTVRGRLQKSAVNLASDSDDDDAFVNVPPQSVANHGHKRQRIIEDDEDEAQQPITPVHETSALATNMDQHSMLTEETSNTSKVHPPTLVQEPAPVDLNEKFQHIMEQRTSIAEAHKDTTIANLPSHVIFCETSDEDHANARALADIAVAFGAYSTADYLSNSPRAADGDQYCIVDARRLEVDIRNQRDYISSQALFHDDISSTYDWSVSGLAVGASIRYIARAQLLGQLPPMVSFDQSESTGQQMQIAAPAKQEATVVDVEEMDEQQKPHELSHHDANDDDEDGDDEEDEEFELELADTKRGASVGRLISVDNTTAIADLSQTTPDDLLFDLIRQELRRTRLLRCVALMQHSEVNKNRSPQLLQGGGCGVVLDYIPYIATMLRLDAASPYAKSTGRRGRLSRVRQATALDAAELAELASIGSIHACENFRESVYHTARWGLDLWDKHFSGL